MSLRFIRPEDRRRSGGSGAGPGFGTDWADTEPACFRSEAFAEDLPTDGVGFDPRPHTCQHGAARVPRRGRNGSPSFVAVLAAVLGWRLSTGD